MGWPRVEGRRVEALKPQPNRQPSGDESDEDSDWNASCLRDATVEAAGKHPGENASDGSKYGDVVRAGGLGLADHDGHDGNGRGRKVQREGDIVAALSALDLRRPAVDALPRDAVDEAAAAAHAVAKATIIVVVVRPEDMVGQLGGDFGVLLLLPLRCGFLPAAVPRRAILVLPPQIHAQVLPRSLHRPCTLGIKYLRSFYFFRC
mmetsp:Transcript_14046/g.34786  ORF Transcript_14046/g.34786 Transcript_14046/m.34786 type:complete len:205 (-) Transcript_14046:473-1087(-)